MIFENENINVSLYTYDIHIRHYYNNIITIFKIILKLFFAFFMLCFINFGKKLLILHLTLIFFYRYFL